MMKRTLFLGVILLVCLQNATTNADISAIEGYNLLDGGNQIGHGSLFGTGYHSWTVGGDTYGSDPLAQDSGGAFYISSAGGSFPVFTFDSFDEIHGNNLTGNAGDTFIVRELQTDLGGGQFLIQSEIIALNAGGGRVDWVAAGTASPNGVFTSWRIDVGGLAAASNLINPDGPFNITTSGFEVFNLAGASLGAFGLSLDLSDSTGLGGVGVVGLGGADIAGFGVSSMQVFFTVQTQTVPEPSSIGLISLMGCCLAWRRRNRR